MTNKDFTSSVPNHNAAVQDRVLKAIKSLPHAQVLSLLTEHTFVMNAWLTLQHSATAPALQQW
jgi:hypothetical protein